MASTISPAELDRLRRDEAGAVLVDVRSPAEFAGAHIAGSRNVPLADLDPERLAAGGTLARDRPVLLLCQGGRRASAAAERFEAAGFAQVAVVRGGLDAWRHEGLPLTESDGGTISLERQVRIAAGALVLLGFVLSLLHPGFLALSAFVGAGLVFAGVTDFCGLGLLLARAPWNTRVAR